MTEIVRDKIEAYHGDPNYLYDTCTLGYFLSVL